MLSLYWLFVCVFQALISSSATQQLPLTQGDKCKEIDSKIWTCTLETNCSSLVKEEREYCSSSTTGEPVICCPPVSADSPTTTQRQPAQPTDGLPTGTTLSTNSTVKKIDEMSKVNQQRCYGTLMDKRNHEFDPHYLCGDDRAFLMGGEFASRYEFPHMARVGHEIKGKLEWICGGSLISKSFVLSAAHCAYTATTVAKRVRLGEHDWKEHDFEAAICIYNIKDIHVPRNYKNFTYNDDLALFRLDRTVPLTFNIRPVCLHADHAIPATSAIATGWGKDTMITVGKNHRIGYAANSILQKVSLNISSDEECNRVLMKYARRGKFGRGVRFDQMLCAGSLDGTRDTCQGDSGGPLQLKLDDDSTYHSYLLVGIISFGDRNCASEMPGVFMRVSEYLPWIDSIVGDD